MTRRRWGTFSVTDHQLPHAFVTDVFLYERLVIPCPPDDNERKRWRDNKWAPGLLEDCLDTLGDLAKPVDWTGDKQALFRSHYEVTQQVARDAMYTTRSVLSTGEDIPKDVWAVAAYPSKKYFSEGFVPVENELGQKRESESTEKLTPDDEGTQQTRLEELCWLPGHSFLVPDGELRNDFYLLNEAIKLAATDEFLEYRSALYEWQEHIIKYDILGEDAIRRMHELLKKYNALVERKHQYRQKKFIFTVVAPGILGLAAPWLSPALAGLAATTGLFLSGYSFLKYEKDPTIPDEYKPAAMFHDIQKQFGWQ
jgi:hypothetical protein